MLNHFTPPRAGRHRVRLLPLAVLVVLTVATTSMSGTAAFAAAPSAASFVALGDSFSSGEGNAPFEGSTDVHLPVSKRNECHRSPVAYAHLLDSRGWNLRPDGFVACSGSEVDTVIGGRPANHEGSQLSKLNASTTAVTISVGGNDMEFSSILDHCVHSGPFAKGTSDCRHTTFDGVPPNTRAATLLSELGQDVSCAAPTKNKNGDWSEGDRCDESLDVVNGKSTGHGHQSPSLAHLYQKISRAAPNAHISVLLYPHLFANLTAADRRSSSGVCNVVTGKRATHLTKGYVVDYEDMVWLNQQVDLVDSKITQQVGLAGGNISVVDPRPLWNGASGSRGHGLCGDGNWLNGLQFHGLGPSVQSFHPNESGQKAFADAFTARTVPGAPQNLTVATSGTSATLTWQAPVGAAQANITGYRLTWDTGTSDAIQNLPTSPLSFTLTGLAPGSHAVALAAVNANGAGPEATGAALVTSSSGGGAGSANAYQAAVTGDSPIGFWPLDDVAGSTTAHDLSGGPSGLVQCGAALGKVPGPIAGTTALHLDGVSCSAVDLGADYAKLSSATGPVTVEAWVREDAPGLGSPTPGVLEVGTGASGLGYQMAWNGYGVEGCAANSCLSGYASTPGDAVWHQLAFVFDPTTHKMTEYSDGLEGGSDAVPGPANVFDARSGALIGRAARPFDGSYGTFDGDIADVSVFDRALSSVQIAAHYAAAVGG